MPNANTLPLDHRTRTAELRMGLVKSVASNFEASVLISSLELEGGFHNRDYYNFNNTQQHSNHINKIIYLKPRRLNLDHFTCHD